MATLFAASTPPPSLQVHTPTAPRLGWEDSFQPYSSVGVTTRSQKRARLTRTPPLETLKTHSEGAGSTQDKQETTEVNSKSESPVLRSPPTATKRNPSRLPNTVAARRVSGTLTSRSTSLAAHALGIDAMDTHHDSSSTQYAMPMTPVKTPVSRGSKKVVSGMQSVARTLFDHRNADVMPQSKKVVSKKYASSFEGSEDASFPIFTDSQDRIPEIDYGADNPFYGVTNQPEPSKEDTDIKRLEAIDDGVEKLEEHKDGMYYVFRGKKIFRKFSDMGSQERSFGENSDEDDAPMGTYMGSTNPSRTRKLITRSAVKPRLLFPAKTRAQATVTTTDEEADTDIDVASDSMTPKHQIATSTPKTPRYAPFTPPTTVRTTRSKDMVKDEAEDEHLKADICKEMQYKGTKKVSLFDGWQRTKNAAAITKKRQGEPVPGAEAHSKRIRANTNRT